MQCLEIQGSGNSTFFILLASESGLILLFLGGGKILLVKTKFLNFEFFVCSYFKLVISRPTIHPPSR